MTDFFQIISAKITAFVTVVMITVTSILPGATSNANKPTDTAIASPSATVSESPKPTPTSSPKPQNKTIIRITPSPSTTLSKQTDSNSTQREFELQKELDKINLQKQVSTEPSPSVYLPPVYSEAECEKQIKEILPQVEASYIDWWNQFREARQTLSPCYKEEIIPICDNKMSKLNGEWQKKIGETIYNYKKGLSACNPNDIRFSEYSEVISSGY